MDKKNQNQIEYLGSVLCLGASIDQETNNVTIFNVIEEINVVEDQLKKLDNISNNQARVVPFAFELITFWRKVLKDQEVSAQVKIELTDPSGNKVQEIQHPITVKKEHKRLRDRVQIRGLKITNSGEYVFLIYLEESGSQKPSLAGKISFTVNILKSGDIKNIKSVA